MNVRGRNASGVKLIDPIVFTIGTGIPKPAVIKKGKVVVRPAKVYFKYRFKINKAWYFYVEKTNLLSAENAAKRQAKKTQDSGTIELVTITKQVC